MDDKRREEISELIGKMESRKYRCGAAAEWAVRDLWNENIALRAELDQARGQLCRVGELQLLDVHAVGSMGACTYYILPKDRDARDWLRDFDSALSSSAPCPHEAEAKRLREAVEWALTVIDETAGMLTDKKQVYHDSKAAWVMLANELRRRAKGGSP